MSPYEQARAVYQREHCPRTFDQDLELHLRNGFVFSTPDFFIMGRHVFSKAPVSLIVDPANHFHRDVCDCWHIYLFAGNIAKAFAIEPWPLSLFSMERKNELRFVPADSIRRLSAARQPAAVTPA